MEQAEDLRDDRNRWTAGTVLLSNRVCLFRDQKRQLNWAQKAENSARPAMAGTEATTRLLASICRPNSQKSARIVGQTLCRKSYDCWSPVCG